VRGAPAARRRARFPDVALAATLHDPPGALLDDLRRALPRLCEVYGAVAVTTSPPTAARVQRLLARAGVHAGTPRANRRGPLYRRAIRRALRSGVARVHYVDLDRALHWLARAPRELAAALRVGRRQRVLVLGRTPRAHRSHQLPLYATETLVNRLFAERIGLGRPLDVLVPSFVLDREAAALLLGRSRAADNAMYGEWAALLLGVASEVGYLECRGLEWETPDRDRRRVRRLGLPAWRRRFETPEEWALRVGMAREFMTGFTRAAARWPTRGVAVRRFAQRAR